MSFMHLKDLGHLNDLGYEKHLEKAKKNFHRKKVLKLWKKPIKKFVVSIEDKSVESNHFGSHQSAEISQVS